MNRSIPVLCLALLLGLSCSQKTEHAMEEAMPVKTYRTLKTRTDSLQSKAQQRTNTLDSIAGQ
jgi:hypothetical protein